MSPGDLLASPLGSQLCWAPILGELSFASLWALLTSINGRSASWASLAGKAQLRQDKKGALLTSINRRSASWASLGGKAQLRQKKADLHNGRSASWAPVDGKPQLLLARLSSSMEGQPAGPPSGGFQLRQLCGRCPHGVVSSCLACSPSSGSNYLGVRSNAPHDLEIVYRSASTNGVAFKD